MSGPVNDAAIERMRGETQALVGPLANTLERLLRAKQRAHYEPGKLTGKLNPGGLHRLTYGDPRIFRRKVVSRVKDTAVELLVDLSGSMGGSKIRTAMYGAFALAAMLQRVNIPCEVIGFSTRPLTPAQAEEMRKAEEQLGRTYSVREVNVMPIFKGWNERMDHTVSGRFADMAGGNSYMASNCDPEAVREAARRLSRRREERKVLMVLSDGHPAYSGCWNGGGEERLREVVREAERAGMEVVGIGIEDGAVADFYPKHVVIHRVAELPAAIMGEMNRILMKN